MYEDTTLQTSSILRIPPILSQLQESQREIKNKTFSKQKKMLSRLAYSAVRKSVAPSIMTAAPAVASNMTMMRRNMGTLEESIEASQAYKNSCYMQIDFTIPEDVTVYEAVQRFSAYNVGCLVTTDSNGKFFMCSILDLMFYLNLNFD